ncbi:hypothetical protein QFZ40_001626 [Arthrobacter pascens]|uniref:hypothetical protein n=1 Tax=Arthrobacter pascens TaxID=1677 RepID=UPI0027834732|nr:hypothetical protein [Arthrobacter pascens]MDQ0633717.1 hypothetical protein [Arthrobacter pascens]
MASDDIQHVTVHFSGRTFTTVEWVNEVLITCEYAYNLAVVALMINDPNNPKITPSDLLTILGDGAPAFQAEANAEFRSVIWEEDRLRVQQLVSGDSFNLELSGISKAIRELRILFDPIERLRRRQSVQHEREMHKTEEHAARRKNHEADYSFMREVFSDPESPFNQRTEGLDMERKIALFNSLFRTTDDIYDRLDRSNPRIIEGTIEPDDSPEGSDGVGTQGK